MAAYQVLGSAHHLRPQRVGGDSDYVLRYKRFKSFNQEL